MVKLFRYDILRAKQVDKINKKQDKAIEIENVNKSISSSSDEDKSTEEYRANEKDILVKIQRAIPKGSLALTNATLITMSGKEIIENGTIILKK